ncbi:MAG: hypothetical protein V4731_04480 [Pseudomonadota bacterium]
MNRCALHLLSLLLVASFASPVLAQPASSQADDPGSSRQFPANALRGVLQVTQPPEVLIDGVPSRLAPGARIKNASNTDVLSGALVDQAVVVNYVREPSGQVHQVWILSAEEARQKRASASGTSAWDRFFGTPSATPAIDANTPYDQLPRYK